jgi:hypothetical protein
VSENEIANEVFNEMMSVVSFVLQQESIEKLPVALQPRLPHAAIIATGGVLSTDTPTDKVEVYDHLADIWIEVRDPFNESDRICSKL